MVASKYCILDYFVNYEGYSLSSKGFLLMIVDIMVMLIKFFHFISLNSKILMFTLAISCLSTSDLHTIHGPNTPASYEI